MKILRFKTNIQNQTMLNRLGTELNKEEQISKWNLDLESADKILSVSGEEISPIAITKVIEHVGFKAEMIEISAIGGHDL